jgi:hypothetical protein
MLQHWGEHSGGDEPVKLRERVREWALAGLSLLSFAGQLWYAAALLRRH